MLNKYLQEQAKIHNVAQAGNCYAASKFLTGALPAMRRKSHDPNVKSHRSSRRGPDIDFAKMAAIWRTKKCHGCQKCPNARAHRSCCSYEHAGIREACTAMIADVAEKIKQLDAHARMRDRQEVMSRLPLKSTTQKSYDNRKI